MTEALKALIEPELINLRLVIHDKDAEIAKLKQQLLEITQQHSES